MAGGSKERGSMYDTFLGILSQPLVSAGQVLLTCWEAEPKPESAD